jgi:hypothetical protein
MEPLAAIGLASNILQMVDFTKKLISQTREIHTSTTGALDIHEGLQASSRNLSELTSSIQGKSSILKFVPSKNFHKSTPERRLWILCQETEDITNDIQNAIERISGDTTTIWKSTRQAFRSIRSEKEMEALKERLDRIYQEVNSAILFSIRYSFREPAGYFQKN